VAPTSVQVVELAIRAWNARELDGPVADAFAVFGRRPLELTDYRTLGDKVVASAGEHTLVFTVRKSVIQSLKVFEPGQRLPDPLP